MEKRTYEYDRGKDIDIDDYEEYYIKTFGKSEEYVLSFSEMKMLYALCKTAINNKLHFTIGIAEPDSYGIHKSPDDKWVVTSHGERSDGIVYGEFDNMYDACICLIYHDDYDWIDGYNNFTMQDRKKIISEFDKNLEANIPDEEILNEGWMHGYYDEDFYSDLAYIIKKRNAYPVDEDIDANKRIIARDMIEGKHYSKWYGFDVEEIIFYQDIAKKLNIDIRNMNDKWQNHKIDDITYRDFLIDIIDTDKHQYLVLDSLKKYEKISNDYKKRLYK